jgi:ABC-2 type transport system permease protein
VNREFATIALALIRASLMTAMQYRSDFLLDGAAGLVRAFAALVPIMLVFGHREELVGWSMAEAMLVMGFFVLMQALLGGLVEPNLGEVVEAIRTGTLDLVLLKPADAQLLVSLRRVQPAHIWGFLAGLVILALSLRQIPVPSVFDVLAALLLLLCGVVAMYSLWVLAICTSFFFVRVDNLRFLLWSISDTGRWPMTVFASWLQFFLVFVVPVGVMTTFPALALRGMASLEIVALGLTSAIGFALLSRWAWKRSLASYTSASS